MFVHIGGEVSVLADDILGVFDIEALQQVGITAEFCLKVKTREGD